MSPSILPIRRPAVILLLAFTAAVLAGCESAPPAAQPQASAAPEPSMTHSRAATECWITTEKGHADMNLDKRADIVTKCIDDKMKGNK
jgi:hypothetical protein